jgi:hypothetical protein
VSLNSLVQKCSDKAQELINKLNKAKAKGPGIWRTIPAAFLIVYFKKIIEGTSKELEGYQLQLNVHLLAALR